MSNQTTKQQEFEFLLKQNKGLIYCIIQKYCRDYTIADDLFQDVAAAAWNGYNSFSGTVKFGSWVGKIARNITISWLRSFHYKMKKVSCDNLLYSIYEPYDASEEKVLPTSVIDSLTTNEKRTLDFVLSGLSYKEISEATGESTNRIAVRMHRIKKLLAKKVS